MVAAGDRILALDETGVLRLVKATPEAYTQLGEAKVADEEAWAHLAVSGSDLFVRDLEGITAYSWR